MKQVFAHLYCILVGPESNIKSRWSENNPFNDRYAGVARGTGKRALSGNKHLKSFEGGHESYSMKIRKVSRHWTVYSVTGSKVDAECKIIPTM